MLLITLLLEFCLLECLAFLVSVPKSTQATEKDTNFKETEHEIVLLGNYKNHIINQDSVTLKLYF